MRLWLCLVLGCAGVTAAERYEAVTGVWRGQMDGVPALAMTISDEGGELTGAMLFYLIRRNPGQPPTSTAGNPEPMFNLKFDGKALDFRVSHRRAHGAKTANDAPVNFRLTITGPNEARLVRESAEKDSITVTRDH
jgi:hypothetical protein